MRLEDDLALDPRIRDWVLMPLVCITFMMGVLRHYLSSIVRTRPRPVQVRIRDASALQRLGALKANASVLPPAEYATRREYYIGDEHGFLSQERETKNVMNILMNPELLTVKLTELLIGIVPQMVFGAWVRYMFGGFAVCRIPFPLPQRFRAMLQTGIEFKSRDLDVSYVSALSWYVLNLFGNQALFRLLLLDESGTPPTENRESWAQPPMPQLNDQMMMTLPQIFKSEKDTLKSVRHEWAVPKAEEQLLATAY